MTSVPSEPASDQERGQLDSGPLVEFGPQPLMAQVLQPVVAQLHDQFALIAQQQADLMVEPIRTTMERYLSQVFDAARVALCGQVDDGVDSLRMSMRDQVNALLDPLVANLRSHMEETVGPQWSDHAVALRASGSGGDTATVSADATRSHRTSKKAGSKHTRSSATSTRRAEHQRDEDDGISPSTKSAPSEPSSKRPRRAKARKASPEAQRDAPVTASGRRSRRAEGAGTTRTGKQRESADAKDAPKTSAKAASSRRRAGGESSSSRDRSTSSSRSSSSRSRRNSAAKSGSARTE